MKAGEERIRIVLHSHNNVDEVKGLCEALRDVVLREEEMEKV